MCITVWNGRLKQVLNSGKCPKISIYFITHAAVDAFPPVFNEAFYRFHRMREIWIICPVDDELYGDALLIHAPFISKRDTMRNHYRLLLLLLLLRALMGFSYTLRYFEATVETTSSNRGRRSFTISLCCRTLKTLNIVTAALNCTTVRRFWSVILVNQNCYMQH